MDKNMEQPLQVLPSAQSDRFFDTIIRGSIEKLEAILKEHPNAKHRQQLQEVTRRYNDPELKLAVIGEFNTGKSTFINGLLKQRYLAMDGVPTTVIPTYIRWDGYEGDIPQIRLWLKGDNAEYDLRLHRARLEKKLKIHLDGQNDLEKITANNAMIDKVDRVTVSFPPDERFRSFCMIDTPGVNPGADETAKHVDITRAVLREEADATIILFPANTVGNRSTLEFISQNASHLLNGAAFVITKADMFEDDQERDVVVDFLKGLVRQRYKLENQTIYTCSAKKALLAYGKGVAVDPYALGFDVMVENLMQDIGLRRKQIILKKVSTLIAAMVKELREEQQGYSRKAMEAMEALEAFSLSNLNRDYEAAYKEYAFSLRSTYNQAKVKIPGNVKEQIADVHHVIESVLSLQNSIVSLRQYIKEDIKDDLEFFQQVVEEDIRQDIEEMDGVYRKFADDVFKRLKKYQLSIDSKVARSYGDDISVLPVDLFIEGFSIDKMIGGLGIGALVLMFLNPGILIAAVVGSFLFSSFIMDKMRGKVLQMVDEGFGKVAPSIKDKWMEALESALEQYLEAGKSLMNEYRKEYATVFKQRATEYDREKRRIKKELTRIDAKLKDLDMIEMALAVPTKLDSYADANRQHIAKALEGDLPSMIAIIDHYSALNATCQDPGNTSAIREWTACLELIKRAKGF